MLCKSVGAFSSLADLRVQRSQDCTVHLITRYHLAEDLCGKSLSTNRLDYSTQNMLAWLGIPQARTPGHIRLQSLIHASLQYKELQFTAASHQKKAKTQTYQHAYHC